MAAAPDGATGSLIGSSRASGPSRHINTSTDVEEVEDERTV